MRPAHREPHDARIAAGRGQAARGQSLVQRSEREVLVPLQPVGESAQRGVAPGGRRQGDAEGQPVRLHPGRRGDRGKIEQVHEVRVIAEVGVQPYRIGEHLGHGIVTPRGRRDENVDRPPHRLHGPLQFLEPIVGGKGVGGERTRPAGDDLTRDRVQSIRAAVDEISNCDVTLGDPWSLVEQPRRFKEGAKIDLDEFAAETLDAPQRLAEEALAFAVAEKLQLAWTRRPEPRSLDDARARAAVRLRGARRDPPRRIPCATASTSPASSAVRAKIETQSSERHAGTTPRLLKSPRVGFRPTMLLNAAGTRPDPAVSVPREKVTRPAATAAADPELEPPKCVWSRTRLSGRRTASEFR